MTKYIFFNNDEERNAAIKQAEAMGYVMLEMDQYIESLHEAIAVGTRPDGSRYWFYAEGNNPWERIPLQSPEQKDYQYNKDRYRAEVFEDGRVILTPKKRTEVWIEVYIDEGGALDTIFHTTKDSVDSSVDEKTIKVIHDVLWI